MRFRRRTGSPGIGEERISPREDALTTEFIRFLTDAMTAAYPSGTMLRSTQAKAHGCVRAEFEVPDGLPPELRHGLFASPGTYPAWIRFANQNPTPQADAIKDIRGMSIKVCGLAGAVEPDAATPGSNQDFVLISSPVFTARDTRSFLALRRASEPRSVLKLAVYFFNPFDPHVRELRNILRSFRRHASPLRVRYFSTTPFRFGAGAAKFAATPRAGTGGDVPADPPDDYLRTALWEALAAGDTHFDFAVQLQTDAHAMPIEDPSREWDERKSPYRTVATIRIPQQEPGPAAQEHFCEALAFNPWRGLPDHRPLGEVNRVRRRVYLALVAQRRERNDMPATEPTCDEE